MNRIFLNSNMIRSLRSTLLLLSRDLMNDKDILHTLIGFNVARIDDREGLRIMCIEDDRLISQFRLATQSKWTPTIEASIFLK